MVTITIKENSKQAKAVIAMLRTFSFVEIQEDTKSPYDPEFVKKIKLAEKEKGKVMNSASELWKSL